MTELQLLDPQTGEILRPVSAVDLLAAAGIGPDSSVGERAAFIDHARELKGIASEAQGIVSDALIAEMDRNGRWTLREDGYEIKGSSPDAGTLAFDVPSLRLALAELVTEGIITAAAANAGLEVSVPTAAVPYNVLRSAIAALDGQLTPDGSDDLRGVLEALVLAEPDPQYTPRLGAIKALLKIPAARRVIELCTTDTPPPRRTARVKRVRT